MNSLLSSRRVGVVALTAVAVCAAGCSSMSERQQGTAKGAGVGAVAGAVIGSATGGSAGKSAVIGGALGAVAGNLWSKHMEDKRKALAQASQGTGVEVTQTADNRLKLNVPSDVSFDTGRADIKPAMVDLRERLAAAEWTRESLASVLKSVVASHKLKFPKLAMPLRVMVTGETQTPSVDAVLELIGRDEVLARMDRQLGAFPD